MKNMDVILMSVRGSCMLREESETTHGNNHMLGQNSLWFTLVFTKIHNVCNTQEVKVKSGIKIEPTKLLKIPELNKQTSD